MRGHTPVRKGYSSPSCLTRWRIAHNLISTARWLPWMLTLKFHGMSIYHNQKAAESFSLSIDFHFSMFNITKRGQENQGFVVRAGCQYINLSDSVVQTSHVLPSLHSALWTRCRSMLNPTFSPIWWGGAIKLVNPGNITVLVFGESKSFYVGCSSPGTCFLLPII